MARPTLQFFFGLFSRRRTPGYKLRRARAPAQGAGDRSPDVAFSDLKGLLNTNALVEDARVLQHSSGEWRLRISLARSCARLAVHLDHSEPTPAGTFTAWQPQDRVLIATRTDVPRGVAVELPVLVPHGTAQTGWRWIVEDDGSDIKAGGPLSSRGRFAFVSDRKAEEHLYFILLWPQRAGAGSPSPVLVDETSFRFKDAWAAEAPLTLSPRWRGR